MAIPFPRSTRSLAADGFRYTLGGLAVACLLIVLWAGWFFGATITFKESSLEASISDGALISAIFTKQQLHRIARGQQARFYPDGTADRLPQGVPAVVTAVDRQAHSGSDPDGDRATVSLIVVNDRKAISNAVVASDSSGRVEIDVEHVPPARLLLRHSGASGSAADAAAGTVTGGAPTTGKGAR